MMRIARRVLLVTHSFVLSVGLLTSTAAALCFPDTDGDGYGDAFDPGTSAYSVCPSGYVDNILDCDGTNPDINLGDCISCPITLTGDVNSDGAITTADILYTINFTFRGREAPSPCTAAADIDCSGHVGSQDTIGLVNYIFKSGVAPCDVCTLIPGNWSCQ